MVKKVILFLSFLVLASCATTSSDIDQESARGNATIVVGKVEVFVNGSKTDIEETHFGKCLLTIENEGKVHKYRLDKAGELYLEANPGAFYFRSLKCGTGTFSESGYVFYPAMPASVLEKGKINYVGDLKINWNLGDSKFSWVSLLDQKSALMHRHGPMEFAIEKNKNTLTRFLKSHPYLEPKQKTVRLFKVLDRSKFN